MCVEAAFTSLRMWFDSLELDRDTICKTEKKTRQLTLNCDIEALLYYYFTNQPTIIYI